MKRIVAGLLLAAVSAAAAADERILSYESEILVHADGGMSVIETIRVRAEGRNIKRGIYRDFPTVYRNPRGGAHRVGFQVISVLRDGAQEAYHIQNVSNGKRVYIGRSNVFLDPGEYTYQLSYYTDRQIGFFDSHDELYWNVTGNGWGFPIDQAMALVKLPSGVPADSIRTEAYTGAFGDQGRDYRSGPTPHGALFVTTRPLRPQEGMTIVVGWPKGLVVQPTWRDEARWAWRDQPALIVVWAGALALLGYYLLAWSGVGRDPKAGLIIPEYEAPKDLSPAAARVIRRMGYDDKALSAALVGLAVKGALTIGEDDDEYSVRPTGERPANLTPGEKAILDSLGVLPLVFRDSNHERVRALRKAHSEALEKEHHGVHFHPNRAWLWPGWILSVAALGIAAWKLAESYGGEAIFALFLIGFIGAFLAPLARQAWRMRSVGSRNARDWMSLAGALVPLALVALFLSFAGFWDIVTLLPWPLVIGAMLLLGLNLAFHHLIKAPTKAGRKRLDSIEGFRQYLGIAESDELKYRYSKPVTPELFEAYLPYAIALDVETQWSERFAHALRASGKMPSEYRTSWYHGHSFGGVNGLSTSCGNALASSVSSSSVAPSSSSGGGGGGFSGGGGGGGGGGGW